MMSFVDELWFGFAKLKLRSLELGSADWSEGFGVVSWVT
jgi:hypothetical protein